MFKNLDDLIAELKTNPEVEVLGVVSASGAGGANSAGNKWSLGFTLESWRKVGGPLQDRRIYIRKLVTQEELHDLMKKIRPYEVIRIRARLAEEDVSGTHQGLLVDLIGRDSSDAVINQCSLKLLEPVTFEDSRFGIFTLDRRVNWYETKTTWASIIVRLTLDCENDDSYAREDFEPMLRQAYLLWDAQNYWNQRITDYAAANLLALKNENWLSEDETEVTLEQFKTRIQVEAISCKLNERFEFWFLDGGLFLGHSILVRGTLREGPTTVGIEG